MWYKTAKYGYVDVQKYIEEKLGYELDFKIEDYLEYIIKKSSKVVHGFMQINFDKMNLELQNSPLNFLIKKFGSMEELSKGNTEGIGAWVPEFQQLHLVPQFPAQVLFKIVDVAMHELAHALDKGAGRYPDEKYSIGNFKAVVPYIANYITKLYNEKNHLLSRDEVWEVFLNLVVDKMIKKDDEKLKDFQKTMIIARFGFLKETILDHIFAAVSNKITDDESAEQFLLKEYYNLPVEAPAQLNSLNRETLPERLLQHAIGAYITHIYSPNILKSLDLSQNEKNTRVIFDKLRERYPELIDQALKNDFINLIRIEIFDDIPNSHLLVDGKDFLLSIRKKHIKRQAYKILNENYAEFKKIVEAL